MMSLSATCRPVGHGMLFSADPSVLPKSTLYANANKQSFYSSWISLLQDMKALTAFFSRYLIEKRVAKVLQVVVVYAKIFFFWFPKKLITNLGHWQALD